MGNWAGDINLQQAKTLFYYITIAYYNSRTIYQKIIQILHFQVIHRLTSFFSLLVTVASP